MTRKAIITEKELTFIMANVLIVKMIFSFPRNLFITSGNAAWIEAVYVSLFAILTLEASFLLYRKSGKKSVVELAEGIGKKPLKMIVSVLCSVVLIINFSSELRTFSESVKIVLLPQTNIEYVMLLLAIAVLIGAKSGIKALGTVNAIFFPVCLVFLGIIIVFLYKNYNVNNLFPIFGTGAMGIFSKGAANFSCFSDILILNLLLPHLTDIAVPKRSGRKAILIASVTLILICLSYGMCYPYARAEEFLLPVYQLSRMIRAGEYFQRFEAFFEFVWTVTQLIYSAIYLFVICETLAEGFEIKHQKMLTYAMVTIISLLSFEPSSVVDVLEISKTLTVWAFPVAYLLPIIIPGIYAMKRRGQ